MGTILSLIKGVLNMPLNNILFFFFVLTCVAIGLFLFIMRVRGQGNNMVRLTIDAETSQKNILLVLRACIVIDIAAIVLWCSCVYYVFFLTPFHWVYVFFGSIETLHLVRNLYTSQHDIYENYFKGISRRRENRAV